MKRNGKLPDSLSTAASAGMGLGQVKPRTAGQVRAAQLVVASHVVEDPRAAVGDPAARVEVREVLRALGICNADARMQEIYARGPVGTRRQPSQRNLPRNHKFPGEREPNGRLSRRTDVRRET